MLRISDQHFQELIDESMASLPGEHAQNIANVAILYAESPTNEQREKLKLRSNETLFGLYEGVPLSQRQGMVRLLPDVITIFKEPICAASNDESELKRNIRHTLWHEIAHYYGLDHDDIRKIDTPKP